MERFGILEMAQMTEVEKNTVVKRAAKSGQPHFAFITLMENDFQMIPEGFTGVYMRDEECQIVPNGLIQDIKQVSIGGFDHVPEDHELHLFINRWSEEGTQLNFKIIEMVTKWMDENL